MPNESDWRAMRALRLLWLLLRVGAVGSFLVFMAYEWQQWPNGSPWLGPLGLIWYFGVDACSLAPCLVLFLLIVSFPFRPRTLTAVASAIGLLAWRAIGVIAQGIGC